MKRILFILIGIIGLSACSEARYAAHVAKKIPMPQDAPSKSVGTFKVGSSYKIKGKRYYPAETYNFTEVGKASWYGPGFHGKLTANGEIFDKNELTAAHRTLQLPSIIQVTNLNNGRQVILRVNDRGPFAHNRILDVSERAAVLLGFKKKGVAKVRIEVLADASKEVAAVAKTGKSTKGFEIAYNKNKAMPVQQVRRQVIDTPQELRNQKQIALNNSDNLNPNNIDTSQSVFNTSPNAALTSVQAQKLDTIVQQAVRPNALQPNADLTANEISKKLSSGKRMFVQAGSFSQEVNALNYSSKLANLGPSRVYLTQLNNQPFYRVRLGPYQDPRQAQTILNSLNSTGNSNAVIVIE